MLISLDIFGGLFEGDRKAVVVVLEAWLVDMIFGSV